MNRDGKNLRAPGWYGRQWVSVWFWVCGSTRERVEMRPPIIGVSGLIGAGKTTLARKLSVGLDLPLFQEPVEDNEYLEDFYSDPKRYGFSMQIYLLTRRFQAHQELVWKGRGGIQDRTIYEDSIFAKTLKDQGMLEFRDYETYLSLSDYMFNFLKEPDLIIFLDVSPEISLQRIEERGRVTEKAIPVEYLATLHKHYADFYQDISRRVKTLYLDWSSFETTSTIVDKINDALNSKG